MTIASRIPMHISTVPTTAKDIAASMGVGYDAIATRLSAMHKAGVLRAESVWVPHSKKPVLHYYKGLT